MLRLLLFLIPSLLFSAQSYASEDIQKLNKEAKGLIMEFASVLKPSLKQAVQTQGPASAIKVCSEIAPQTAKQLSVKSGWEIKRVSLKARNHKSAKPDKFEQKILEKFEHYQYEGQSVAEMKHSEVVDGEFRFMKPQGVEQVCLACHGKEIKPEIKKALAEFYPEDVATGYQLGEIRGAYSLTKKLN